MPVTVTKRQMNFIKDIEQVLDIKYRGGNSRRSASDFIAINLKKFREHQNIPMRYRPLTGKQARLITDIENYLDGVKFGGKTIQGAQKFIDDWYYDYVWEKIQVEEDNPLVKVRAYVREEYMRVTRRNYERRRKKLGFEKIKELVELEGENNDNS